MTTTMTMNSSDTTSSEMTHTPAKKHQVSMEILVKGKTGKLNIAAYLTSLMRKANQHDDNVTARKSCDDYFARWNERSFKVNENTTKLDKERKAIFHTFIMKARFLCKRVRSNIDPAIGFLSSRVKEPDESDLNKLMNVLAFLTVTMTNMLTLEADYLQMLVWYFHIAFAVHPDVKSHTGSVFSLGKGAISASSTKQKTNSRSSTEAEMNGVDQ